MNTILKDTEDKMKKTLETVQHEFSTVRTGRASASLLDMIKVEAYGNPMPIKQLANVTIPEPRTIQIQPWDPSQIGAVEKAILKSDLGITPQNDGKIIRLHMPQLTEERRKELVKVVHKMSEEKGRIAVRNERRDAMEKFKKLKKDGQIPEDEEKHYEKKIQELHDKFIVEIDKAVKKKEEEIMAV